MTLDQAIVYAENEIEDKDIARYLKNYKRLYEEQMKFLRNELMSLQTQANLHLSYQNVSLKNYG